MTETRKFIEKKGVKLFLKSIGGDFASIIALNLAEPISDEELAEKCGMRSADARMILNKMHKMGIIDYNRSKDKESGWYYYAWFLRTDKLYNEYLKKMQNDLEDIEERLENSEVYTLYICRKCEQTYDFDKALELLYHCPLCESILDKGISDDDLKKMKRIAINIKKEIAEVKNCFSNLQDKKYKSMKVL